MSICAASIRGHLMALQKECLIAEASGTFEENDVKHIETLLLNMLEIVPKEDHEFLSRIFFLANSTKNWLHLREAAKLVHLKYWKM